MIFVRLKGGLGNQMFQYAFALSYASTNNTDYYLDKSFLDLYPKNKSYTFRKFNLDTFNLNPEDKWLVVPDSLKFRNKIYHDGLIKAVKLFYGLKYVKEDFNNECSFYMNQGRKVYFNGYWQNPCYFENNREKINSAFKIKSNLITFETKRVIERIIRENSVSIHIRGGDYLVDLNNKRFGNVTLNYYKKACNYLSDRFQNLTFNVFTNDHISAKRIIKDIGVKANLIDVNANGNEILDLLLMKSCNHNIIANSTFSWWAAYLNESENKTIIAPKNWFGDQPLRSMRIIPKNWIRI